MQTATDYAIRYNASDSGGANWKPSDRFGSGAAEYHHPSRAQSTAKHRFGEFAGRLAGSSGTKPIEPV
jgi:hypothetical protein